jgi:hypothetical protein
MAGSVAAHAAGPPETREFSISVAEPREGGVATLDLRAESWRARVEQARRRYEAYAARAYERYLLFSGAASRRAMSSPLAGGERGFAAVLKDPTLRPNDIYVSERGFLVFRGGTEPPYAAADFQPMPLERVRALSLKLDSPPK